MMESFLTLLLFGTSLAEPKPSRKISKAAKPYSVWRFRASDDAQIIRKYRSVNDTEVQEMLRKEQAAPALNSISQGALGVATGAMMRIVALHPSAALAVSAPLVFSAISYQRRQARITELKRLQQLRRPPAPHA